MRTPKAFAACLAAVMAAGLLAGAAHAQSFIQKVFGFGGTQTAAPASPRAQSQTIPASRFYGRSPRRSYQLQSTPAREDDAGIGPPDSGGPYRTVCVRTCDGFYFPLRHNAVRKNFASDVKSCRAACGSDARLFYFSVNGGSADTMTDLAGRSYAGLPHAFAYRKALMQGCSCKPTPWSQEEAMRHQGYEAIEATELAKDQVFLEARAAQKPNETQSHETQAHETHTDVSQDATVVASREAEAPAAAVTAPAAPDAGAVIVAPAPERSAIRKRFAYSSRPATHKAQFKPASWSPFSGSSKSKYVWPGDAR